MDPIMEAMEMVDHLAQPAFCVAEGIIVKVNPAAKSRFLEPGASIKDLLQTGQEEYAALECGQLFLNVNVCGKAQGFSVTRKPGFDLFVLEQESDDAELQAMALAARELREPLASVMITADRLFPTIERDNNPATRDQVSRINRGLFQMLRIISNMSDAERYCTDNTSHQEVRDICGLLDEIFTRAITLVAQAGIQLTYTGISEPIYTLVDGEKLERAIFNILSNAIKFTPRDGSIQATLTRQGNKLYLSVQDSGSGIREDVRGTVFSRYTRQPSIEDGRFGIGLGMVLIRSAAALHGGTVLIDSPAEAGTRVTMSLAIRSGSGGLLRSPVFRVDYAGERDHGLLELSDTLPAAAYQSDNIN